MLYKQVNPPSSFHTHSEKYRAGAQEEGSLWYKWVQAAADLLRSLHSKHQVKTPELKHTAQTHG